ncbi:hypothetical protein N0V82_002181 [Gnomoniopsis sp. IMI 355080]|nr:hypothetical protein N0V82_002181 [Gnomoniopsis sp. IMI 355080]
MQANMGPRSKDFHIPTINIAPYLRDPMTDAARRVVRDVRDACMSVGFFSMTGHGIPKDLQDNMLTAAKRLFNLPLEEKKTLKHPLLKNRGYEIIGAQALQSDTLPDLKEGYYVGNHLPADSDKAKAHPHLLGENIFPTSLGPSEFQKPAERYYSSVLGLSLKVMELLAKGLPYGDTVFDDFVSNDPACVIRLLHYPPQTSQDHRQLGAGAHTDFGAITLLLQDSAGGLEVLDDTTNVWHAVVPDHDAYVVNIGDMLSLWTKGIYKSALHRVINKSGGDRYSVPFFFDGNPDVKLRPLDGSEPVGGIAPTVEEHMLERLGTSYSRVKPGG